MGWRDLFETYDTNRDGYIDNVELGKQLNDMNLEISNQELNDMINLFDSDGDRKLNTVEYQNLVQSERYTDTKELEAESDLYNEDKYAPNNDKEFIYYGIIAFAIILIISLAIGLWICWKRKQRSDARRENLASTMEEVELLDVTNMDNQLDNDAI